MGYQLWDGLVLDRLLPSVTSTVGACLVIHLVILFFRVRNPQTLYVLLHLPLLKGLVVLVSGVPSPMPGSENGLHFGLRLMGPWQLVPLPSYEMFSDLRLQTSDVHQPWGYDYVGLAFLATALIASGLLVYRWAGLVAFYRRLLSMPPLRCDEGRAVFSILDRLVPIMGVAYPRVVVLDRPAVAPCSVGLRSPTIALSSRLLAELDEEKLEAVLAHELAHVARRDAIFHWPSLLLRDLLAFNPVAHRLFSRLLAEREKDADLRAAAALGNPRAMAKALVDVALLAHSMKLRPAPGSMTLRQNLLGRTSVVEERVRTLLEGPVASCRLRPLGLGILLLLLLIVHGYVQFPLLGTVIILEF